MSKKMTFRKKGLAVILCLMMGIATIAGCGKEEETPVVEADEDALEIPEVKGKEETVGAFTLLVPKGMEAEEGSSESVVTLSDDDDASIVFQVVEKSEAKDYVKALIEEDDSFEEISFSLDGTKWNGASYKKDFVVYAKIGKTTVIAIGTGYKYTDDIPLAVLASLEVESDAETVSIGGASGKGGTYVYGDGLFTVEYTGAYREADPSSEFGDLVSKDGNQKVYITSVYDWDDLEDLGDEIASYNYDMQDLTVDGKEAILFTYEDYFGDITADFVIPLDWVYRTPSGDQMVAVRIYTTGSSVEEAASDDFMELIKSVDVNDEYVTDESETSSYGSGDWESYWERGWYGFWIVSNACTDFESNIGYAYDCLATFDCEGDEVHMQVVNAKSEGDLDVDVYFNHYEDSTESGWLISEQGQILGYDIGYYDASIDPEADARILDDYISMRVDLYDDDGNWVLELSFFLRPWGSDFDEFLAVPESNLPYMCVDWDPVTADMFPFNYDSWYVNVMDDPFPGLDAIIGQVVE
ncbi:MAG: hypothetical protein J6W85_01475 [Lachnospiraceae bacterium]|nr:hypothetical protein [Lachnospiraceae bacterium]MBP5701099.1 hypothetical protein [Lachnospiraceae bacterium]